MKKVFILKFLAIVVLIESVTCVKDVRLKQLSFNTITTLLNILSKYEDDIAYVKIQPNERKLKGLDISSIEIPNNFKSIFEFVDLVKDRKFQKPGRHILIKRLLPHGLSASKLEFDTKFKTIYRPLVRVHKRKLMPKIETILNIDRNMDATDKHGIDIYDYYDNDENVINFAVNKELNENLKHFNVKEVSEHYDVDEELVQPFMTKFSDDYESLDDVSTQLRMLEEIQKLLKKIRSRSTRANTYRDIIRVLDKISSLRTYQKSGEDNDPMAPGKPVHQVSDDAEEGPQRPKKWISQYPSWNYWTYKKTIYQDVCPAGQVKVANLCIWLPPH